MRKPHKLTEEEIYNNKKHTHTNIHIKKGETEFDVQKLAAQISLFVQNGGICIFDLTASYSGNKYRLTESFDDPNLIPFKQSGLDIYESACVSESSLNVMFSGLKFCVCFFAVIFIFHTQNYFFLQI